MQDRLVAGRVGIGGIDREADQAIGPAVLPLSQSGLGPDELALIQRDEAVEAGFSRGVDRAVFARPGAVALGEAHRMQRARAEALEAQAGASLDERLIERALVLRLDPDLETEVARE